MSHLPKEESFKIKVQGAISILKISSIKNNDSDGLNYMNVLSTLLKIPVNGLDGLEVMTHPRILVVN